MTMDSFIMLRTAVAADAPGLWRAFFTGQCTAYSRHGMAHLLPERPDDMDLRGVHLVTAERPDGHLCGGIRLHLRSASSQLPIERHLGDPRLSAELESRAGVGECSGTWVASEYKGSGLSRWLVVASMAASPATGMTFACSSAHGKAMPLYASFGFSFDVSRPYLEVDPGNPAYVSRREVPDFERPGRPYADLVRRLRLAFEQTKAAAVPLTFPSSTIQPCPVPSRVVHDDL